MTRPFLSIRWRIVCLAGLALALTAGLFSWQQQADLQRRFESDQAAWRERARDMAGRLFLLQAHRGQVLGRMLAELPAARAALLAGNAARLEQSVAALWPELNLGQGLKALVFHDAAGRVLAAWGEPPASGRLSAGARAASRRERPASWLECAAECVFQVVLPIVEQGRALGSVALVAGLEDVILDLRRLSGAEVAVLAGRGPGGPRPLAAMRLLSASGGEQSRALFKAARDAAWTGDYHRLERAGRIHHLVAFPAPVEGDGQAHLALSADVTWQADAMAAAARRNLAWGAAVLGLAMLLLFLLLRPAMARIERIARSLPLLGQEQYQAVRDTQADGPATWFRDEMDDLAQLAVALADRLEHLGRETRRHAEALAAQAAQLERERDFVAGLLDTAPVLIATFGDDDRVRLANARAVHASGRPAREVLGGGFTDLFLDAARRPTHMACLGRAEAGGGAHEECALRRPDGQTRHIVWFYSTLARDGEARTWLAAGLDVTDVRLAERRLSLLAAVRGEE